MCSSDLAGGDAFDVRRVGLWQPRAVLAERIATRVDVMRAAGLADEVDAVAAGLSRTAAQAIGYKELLALYRDDRPLRDAATEALDHAFSSIVQHTTQFARRQRMWFRRDPSIVWFAANRNADDLARAVLACWGTP